MTSWPPRNPGGSGHMPKPESVRKKEDDLNAKWEMPQAPETTNKTPTQQQISQAQNLPPNAHRMQANAVKSDGSKPKTNTSSTASNTIPQESSKNQQKQQDVGSSNQTPATTSRDTSSQPRDSNPQPRDPKSTNGGKDLGGEVKETLSQHSSKNAVSQPLKANQNISMNEENETVERNLAVTPPRNRGLSGGTPKGTPSKFDIDSIPVYSLDSQYQDVSFQMPTELENRVFNPTGPMELMDKTSSMAIGKIGEEIVFQYFRNTLYRDALEAGKIEIIWLNEEEETGQPYDLIVKHQPIEVDKSTRKKKKRVQGCEQQQRPDIYVEVKTTLANEEKQFEISSQQLKFAIEHGPNFHLYRVSGLATQPEFRLRSLENLSNHMDKKAVKMYMIL